MRPTALAALAFAGACLAATPAAQAGFAAGIDKPTASSLVERVDYARRFYRRNGYLPRAAPVIVTAPPVVIEGAPVIVEVPLAPPRPASCCEFHFWNGVACVDARYNKVNVGPRP